jgi:hypothetical protein
MNDYTWKIGEIKLSAMTYTFKCDNEKCKKKIICLMSKYDESEYFGRCSYCQSGRMKWIQNIDLLSVLKIMGRDGKTRRIGRIV